MGCDMEWYAMKGKFPTINKKLLLHYALVGVFLYFVFHVIYGNRGILAYFKLHTKIDQATQELDVMRAERLVLEHKVNSLKTESLDRDMLDEEARRGLGLAGEKEKVFVPEENEY